MDERIIDGALDCLQPVPLAKEKLWRLCKESSAANLALISVSDSRRETFSRIGRLEQRIAEIEADYSAPTFRQPDDHVYKKPLDTAKAELARERGEYARLCDHEAKKSKIWHGISAPVTRAVEYLRGLPVDVQITAFAGKPPKVSLRYPTYEDVEKVRVRRRESLVELNTVRSAPWPSKLAKTRLREEIAVLAARGMPHVVPLVETLDPVEWGQTWIRLAAATSGQASGKGMAAGQVFDALGFFCWLLGDQIIAKLDAEIDQLADDANALDEDQRREVEAKLKAEILANERSEELLIELAESQGTTIVRRPDCDPRALLGLSDDLPGLEII